MFNLRRAQQWKQMYPYFNNVRSQVVHPTAVYEHNGELYTLLINGLQPKNKLDLFLLWNLRFKSDCIL